MTQFLEDQNPLRPEDHFETLNSSRIVTLRCPHCSTLGSFQIRGQEISYSKKVIENDHKKIVGIAVSLRQCPRQDCQSIVMAIELPDNKVLAYPPERIDFDASDIPLALIKTLGEAVDCHAAGAFRACAMMVRRLLEEICDDAGVKGKTLHARLEELRSKIAMPEELFAAMFSLKALGNDAAHISAKDFSNIGKEEAETSIELAKEILKSRFQLKSLLDRLNSRKTP